MNDILSIGHDRVVVTGIGITSALGYSRESTWWAVQQGKSGVRTMRNVAGVSNKNIPAAMVDFPIEQLGQLKTIPMAIATAEEAIQDAGIRSDNIDRNRFGSFISGNMADTYFLDEQANKPHPNADQRVPWAEQWLPPTTGVNIRKHFDIRGTANSHVTACASSTIDFMCAKRAILDDQCDIAITGAAEFIHPMFAAGFYNMRALAQHDTPEEACRPFDSNRNGFVMGEGAAMLILERLSHARRRGATVYAEVLGGCVCSDASHLTGIQAESDTLSHVIKTTLQNSNLVPSDIDYICAHGTGTLQNDIAETIGIRRGLGKAADSTYVTSLKPLVGHLVNASGSMELALTALCLRDGFTPPTINLTQPDPSCDLDYVPLIGRRRYTEHAMKLSLAFGGHVAAVAMRRWDQAGEARSAKPIAAAA